MDCFSEKEQALFNELVSNFRINTKKKKEFFPYLLFKYNCAMRENEKIFSVFYKGANFNFDMVSKKLIKEKNKDLDEKFFKKIKEITKIDYFIMENEIKKINKRKKEEFLKEDNKYLHVFDYLGTKGIFNSKNKKFLLLRGKESFNDLKIGLVSKIDFEKYNSLSFLNIEFIDENICFLKETWFKTYLFFKGKEILKNQGIASFSGKGKYIYKGKKYELYSLLLKDESFFYLLINNNDFILKKSDKYGTFSLEKKEKTIILNKKIELIDIKNNVILNKEIKKKHIEELYNKKFFIVKKKLGNEFLEKNLMIISLNDEFFLIKNDFLKFNFKNYSPDSEKKKVYKLLMNNYDLLKKENERNLNLLRF